MENHTPVSGGLLAVLLLLSASLSVTQAHAQPAAVEEELIEEVVVTGTRRVGTLPTETLSPVDVLGGERLARQSAFDITDSLTAISPSLNTQRFPIADGTALIRPVTLRNLSPDQTLVLVNGTRRHRSPLVNLQLAPLGTVNQGSQGVDWSAIPTAAIERVEVLRDGASAQYGSDAIAGVINVILKDADSGLTFDTQYGQYGQGDGERFTIGANWGFAIGEGGYANLTGEYALSNTTSRGIVRGDAADVGAFLGEPNDIPLGGLGQRWGDPDTDSFKLAVNFGYGVGNSAEVFGFATYTSKDIESDFFYRRPNLPAAAGIALQTPQLAIDNDGDFVPDPAPQTLVDDIVAQGLSVPDLLVPDATSPSGFRLENPIAAQFPGGYNPDFGADLSDFAVVAGIKGDINDSFTYNVRGRYADSEVDYELGETINPSLGITSPLEFNPGTLSQEEASVNADFVQTLQNSPVNIAFGAEWRRENYVIGEGDPLSILAGPTASFFGVGSDGFQGFPVESAGDFESDSFAFYLDVESDITEQLTAAFAIRYENFTDFDATSTDIKLSLRYQFNETLAVRGTFNTGFRIPTAGQVNTLNVTTTSNAAGELVPNGTFPVNNPISIALGAQDLDEEESISFTAGVVWQPTNNIDVTLDYYRVAIDDRLALLNNTVSAADVVTLTAAGVADAANLAGSSVNFFVNGFDSDVNGIDVAITGDWEILGGLLNVDLRHNFNDQNVSNVAPGTINQSRVFDLENQVPNNSTVLSLDYSRGPFDGLVRLRYYDDWSTTGGLFSPGDASDIDNYSGDVLVDLELGYDVTRNYRVTVGAENLFDVEPEDELNPVSRFLGVDLSLTSPFGFNGVFWYARFSAFFN